MTRTPTWRQSTDALYGLGRTTIFACQFDQRFSYCLYVPLSHHDHTDRTYPLAVVVHGTSRTATQYRDAFAEFAETHQCIVLAPLFPAGIPEPGNLSNYKFIKCGDIRFDNILLAMIDEIARTYRVRSDRFLLHGFSGGGHFAHRFFYLHPDRCLGVSIGAPGMVTLLDRDHDFWVGIRDLEEVFGIAPDFDEMRRVPIQMIVGGDDTETWEITIEPGNRLWMEGASIAGENRQDRMQALKTDFEREGIAVQHIVVPGIGHEGFKLVAAVQDFFASILNRQ